MRFVLLLCSLVISAVAAAEPAVRPTLPEAKRVAAEWIAAVKDEGAAPASLTASPFLSVAYDETGRPACAESTATTDEKITAALACLRERVGGSDGIRLLSPKVRLAGPLPRHRKQMSVLEANATLLHVHERCVGEGRDVVLAVRRDGDGAVKIAAVFAASVLCGE